MYVFYLIMIPIDGGGASIPRTTTTDQVSDWILKQDKLPLLLSSTISDPKGPIRIKQGFKLVPWSKSVHVAAWVDRARNVIVGLRGTGVFMKGFLRDLQDDAIISGQVSGTYTDMGLVKEGKILIQRLQLLGYKNICIVGHSLGGTSAMVLATMFPNTRAISLFGGAPALNPFSAGPGPGRATHYHILGDLVSSHCTPRAANVIRIYKKGFDQWGFIYPHLFVRILKNDDRQGIIITPDQEQVSWESYGFVNLFAKQIIKDHPIPGSNLQSIEPEIVEPPEMIQQLV